MIRKVTSVLLLAVLVLCAVSCSSDEQKPTDAHTPEMTTAAQPTAQTAAQTAAVTEKSELQELADFFGKLKTEDFNDHGYTITIRQKYNIEKHTDNEKEKADLAVEYEGLGTFTVISRLANTTEEGAPFSGKLDAFTRGVGYIDQNQKEKAVYRSHETDKVDNESREFTEAVEIDHTFKAKYDKNTLYASVRTVRSNPQDASHKENVSFDGKIEKTQLTDLLSDELLDSFVEGLIFMDGYSYFETLNDFSQGAFIDEENVDPEADDYDRYIDVNDSSISAEGNIVTFRFSIYGSVLFAEEQEQIDRNATKLYCSILFDTELGKIVQFRYDLKDFISAFLQISAKEGETISAQIDDFCIEGNLFTVPFEEIEMTGEFTAYEDASAFIESVGRYANPMKD